MKYTTKENAMQIATGMNADEREDFRNDVSSLMKQRKTEKDPQKKKEIEAKINQLMGW